MPMFDDQDPKKPKSLPEQMVQAIGWLVIVFLMGGVVLLLATIFGPCFRDMAGVG